MQLLGRGGAPFAQPDMRSYRFTLDRVGDTVHRRLGDIRVAVEGALDLGRVDLETRDVDHILEPIDYIEIAFVVGHANIAGMEPAVADRLAGSVGPVPVAQH